MRQPMLFIRSLLAALASFCLIGSPDLAFAAGNAVFQSHSQGVQPFFENESFAIIGASLSSVTYSIQPMQGSSTRPLTATFSSSYLSSQGLLSNGNLLLQIFGLYALPNSNYLNTIHFTFKYADGSVSYIQDQVATQKYVDPCSSMENRVVHQYRTSQSDIGYDYIYIKDYCRSDGITNAYQCNTSVQPAPPAGRSGAILDTDGYIRWVNTANVGGMLASILTNNNKTVYQSNGLTGLNRIDVNTGNVVKDVVDFKNYNSVTGTNEHNIDPGRNGTMIVGVCTKTDISSQFVETDGVNILNFWDMGNIIRNAMIQGGDSQDAAAEFTSQAGYRLSNGQVLQASNQWFHANSVAYRAADNTLVISSRENFVIAVDYDPPANGGIRQIHWILGDTTKDWYQNTTLKRFALSLESSSDIPPIGQHGASFDPNGYLTLMNDGYQSVYHVPKGEELANSFGVKYRLDLNPAGSASPGAATTVWGYGGYGGGSSFESTICGSNYDFHNNSGDSYLEDFADEAAANSTFPNPPASYFAQVQGLKANENLVFDMEFPGEASACNQGWNTVPVDLSALQY